MTLFKNFFCVIAFLTSSLYAFAEVTTNTQIIDLTPEEIGDLKSDTQISEKLLTSDILIDAVFSSAAGLPEHIRQKYSYKAYFLTTTQQRLGIAQMIAPNDDGDSTIILGVKSKKMVILSCVTQEEPIGWYKGKCAKALEKAFNVKIDEAMIKENEQSIALPKN